MFELKVNDVNMVTIKWYIDNLKDKIKMSKKEEQKALVDYEKKDLEKVINNIMNNLCINNIAITNQNELVDGYKKINAIDSFIDGFIKYNGKYYFELSDEEKEIFDNYYFGIFVR